MIDNEAEYRRMFEVEQKLWWYTRLHRMVLNHINRNFVRRDLQILDAACGTGGLLHLLRENGYNNCSGFDASPHAVAFSLDRGLDVGPGDLKDIAAFRPEQTYDVICCNDALYFLSDTEIANALKAFRQRLNKGGILLVNIHAFQAFSGSHDVAVGSSRRFTLKDFTRYSALAGLQIVHNTYWPFFLSLPILLVRTWQRFQIKKGVYTNSPPASDVKYPGDLVNGTLNNLMRIEETFLPSAPFGSSLFMKMKA